MTPKLFSELNLSPEILKAIDKLGFEQASPIQAEAIPVLMSGKDVVGQSQTGSGKTAAFAIPAIEKTDPHLRAVQVLILCPTRELAVQVAEEVHKLALFKRGIHALPIYGGQSYDRQYLGLRQGAQIVIGTPGRVMDHMRRGTLRLDQLKMIVLDEADVMLDMGFREDIEFVLQGMPAARQTVFFSATMPKPIRDLIEKFAREPQSVAIEQKALTVPTVDQVYYEVDRRFKIELLTRLIDIHDYKLGIVFCNTKRMVDDLVDHLNAQGYSADRLHGDMSQAMRDRVMNKFRKGGLEFLVATDVAARGIDVNDVQVVFNYDIPYDAEDYVHRIGRTGRAGRSGRAISFVSGREFFQIQNIGRFTNMRIERGRVPTQNEVEEARSNVMVGRVRTTLQEGKFKPHEHLIERLMEEGFQSTEIAAAALHLLQTDGGGSSAPRVAESRAAEPEPPRARPQSRPQERWGDEGRREYPRQERGYGDRQERSYGDRPEPRQALTRTPREPLRAAYSRPAPYERPVRPKPVTPAKSSPAPAPRAIEPSPSPAEAPAPKVVAAPEPAPAAEETPRRHAPRSGAGFTRLWMNIGAEMGVGPNDIVGAILGETGLPAKVVGQIDLRDRHVFVDVAADAANAILAKIKRTMIKGHRVKAKVA